MKFSKIAVIIILILYIIAMGTNHLMADKIGILFWIALSIYVLFHEYL